MGRTGQDVRIARGHSTLRARRESVTSFPAWRQGPIGCCGAGTRDQSILNISSPHVPPRGQGWGQPGITPRSGSALPPGDPRLLHFRLEVALFALLHFGQCMILCQCRIRPNDTQRGCQNGKICPHLAKPAFMHPQNGKAGSGPSSHSLTAALPMACLCRMVSVKNVSADHRETVAATGQTGNL